MARGVVPCLFRRQVLHPFLVVDHLAVLPAFQDEPFHGYHHVARALEEDDVVLVVAHGVKIDVVEAHDPAVVEIFEKFVHCFNSVIGVGLEMKAYVWIVL